MDRRAWRAAALGVAKSQTQLSDQTTTTKSPSLWCFADPRADMGTMGCPPHLRLVWDSLHSWAVSEGRMNDLNISYVFIYSTSYRALSSMRLYTHWTGLYVTV